MREVLVIKTGSTLPRLLRARGDYEDWIAQGLGLSDVRVCRVTEGEPLPAPDTVRAVVITGSSAMVTERRDWSERTADWLRESVSRATPTLGICYGHQLLADALGGEVGDNPKGRELGTVTVMLDVPDDPLLGGMGEPLVVNASHRQSVLRLPEGALRLAHNETDANQAFRIGERIFGVQFHPEWDHDVIRAYLEERAQLLREEGRDPDALLAEVRPSEHGSSILRRFGEIVSARS